MARNRGKEFESRIETLLQEYSRTGVAKIHKVDPPSCHAGRRVILMENPWLDFQGVWTVNANRAIAFEAKRTDKPLLPINTTGGGGMSPKQWASFEAWTHAGATTFVLWEHLGEIRIITHAMCRNALAETKRKSLRWIDAIRIAPGEGRLHHDFLRTAYHLTN
jgi:penicillin-binding protein-related factor A (putative recombinase)